VGQSDLRMSVWFADGEVVAWGRTGYGQLDLIVDPTRPDLADEVLDWAEEPVTVTIMDTEKDLGEVLGRRGYSVDLAGPFFEAHSRDLADLPPIPDPPAGFTVRAVRGPADAAAWVAIHRDVWHPSTFDDAGHRAMTADWPYRPDVDIVVEAPDGRFVAYCLGWYDEVNQVGLFEPVGTREDHRRRGLSRLAGIAALHAFRQAGGRTAIVVPRGDDGYPIPKQVYRALGFTPHARTVNYRR